MNVTSDLVLLTALCGSVCFVRPQDSVCMTLGFQPRGTVWSLSKVRRRVRLEVQLPPAVGGNLFINSVEMKSRDDLDLFNHQSIDLFVCIAVQ